MFTVIISNRASRKTKKMPQHYLARIKELFITLRENPIPATIFDVAKIRDAKASIASMSHNHIIESMI